MPYVPSKKTIPPAEDRVILDPAIEAVAKEATERITNNLSLIGVYKNIFLTTADFLDRLLRDGRLSIVPDAMTKLAQTIFEVGCRHGYEGAHLGEFNYVFTRFIQRVPQIKVRREDWKETDELRYWLYALTVEALSFAAHETRNLGIGVSGVFEDVKDEYKWEVNRPYEVAQIIKSGHCYDTPYYSRVVEVVDNDSRHVGHIEIMLKRSPDTINLDVLPYHLVLQKK